MKNKSLPLILSLFTLFIFNTNVVKAQAPFKYLTYIFPSDSLKGFDEAAANKEALDRGFFGSEYHVIMYSQKRDFINKKYGYTYGTTMGSNAKGGPSTPSINAAPCVNEDFESSPSSTSTTTVGTIGTSLLGWQASWGQNSGINGSCTQAGCCPNAGSTDAWIRTTPWTAPAPLGVIPASPFGGTKVIQMNDNITMKGEVVRIQQTFPVTASNALFQFAYKAAMDGSGHACCDQPYIRVELLDCMNNILACPQVSITPPGPSCATVSAVGWTTSGNISYTPNWIIKAIDLSPYLGSCVTIKVTVGDCDGWAHYGYAFFDFQCLPMTVTVNNIQFPAGNAVVAVAACGVTTGTMVAPPGLGPYTWNGPPGSGITANPNQTITTTMPGNYTLTMNPIGICTPITKTVNLQFGTFPTAGFTSANSCTTYTLTNTGTGPPSVQTYSFVGPGAPTSFTTTNATSVVNFAPSTTYTIIQTVTNPQNCPATFSMVITTPPGPSPAFTASPSFTQCLTGNAFTFNATTTTGTHTYNFNPTVGSPPTGNTNPYGPVSFTAPGNYTVTHTVNSAGCVSSTQSVVVVNAKPTASATATPPACSGGQAVLTGVGGPGSITWAGPLGWTGVGTPVAVNNFTTGNQGTYTMTVNNFGCITTTTVNITMPAVPSVTVTNTGPYCVGQTIQLNAVTSSTNISWSYWYNSTWTWTNFSSTLTPTISNAQTTSSGVYWFYVSWAGGCWAQASTTVQVVNTPTVSASNTGPYCPGATIQLNTPTAAGSYTWTGPSSFSSSVQNPTTTASTSGNYTVMIGNGSCTAAAVTSVVVTPLASPTITSNSPVCAGSPLTFSTTAATSYTWSGPGGFTSSVQSPTIASATSTMAGVYTVTIANAAGCKATATINVTVTTPTTSASNTGPYCAGQTISLNTPAGTSYTWTGPSAFTSNNQNPTIANSTTAMSGVYTVTTTTGLCKATATTNVVVNPLPAPAPTNTGPYCPGNTIQLNVGAFNTYTWSGPSSFASNAQNPTQTNAQTTNSGNYTVTVTNATGCTNTAITNVVVNPTPTVVVGSNSPVCLNSNINLTASGGTGYSWSGPNAFTSAVQNPVVAAATAVNAGVYTVTVTALGCTNTGTVNVTVLTPTTSASNTGPFCVGSTIQLNTPSATSYTWSGPGGFTSNAQNPTIANATAAMAGTYSVLVSAGTCTANATTNVVINALPTPAPTNTGPYCPGNTIQLNVGAFTTYTWSGPSAFTSNAQNPTQTNAQTTNGGNYVVTVTDANGCVNSATTTVVVNPTPVVVIGSNSPICLNTALNLTSGGGTGYAWSGPSAFTSALQNPTIPNATAANAGIYTVTVTALGCTNTGTVSVSVLSPTTSAANTGAYCAGQTINLSTPAATTYNWTGPLGFTSTAQNPTIPASTTGMSGVYSVTVSVGTCTAAATTNVLVNPLPTPVANNTGAYCPGNTISLSVGAFSTYTWSGPSSFSSNAQNPTQTNAVVANSGNYTVTVTDANGCTNTAVTNVVVNPSPVVVMGSNSPVCINTPINLTSSGGTTYSWSGPNAFTSALQNPNIPNATTAEAGVYTVTVTALGCSSTGTLNVVVTTPTTSAANTGPYCAGTTINLNAATASSYTWSGPGGYSSNSQNATQPSATTLMSGTYTVIVSIGTCTASATTNVLVNPLPTPNIVSNSPVCVGQPINFTGTGGTTYTWTGPGSFSSNSATPNIGTSATSNAGNYVLSVTDANGCVNSTNANVVVNALPLITVNNPTNCVNTTIGLTATGGTAYAWSGPGGFTSTAQNPNIPAAQLTMSGTYVVTVTDANGCVNTANASVNVFPLPTPNITSNSPVCAGGILNLFGSGGTTYAWSGPGYTGPTQNPTINNVNASASGVYTLLASLGSCTASTTFTVLINPLPVFNFTGSNVLCFGQSNGTSTVNVTVGTGPFNYNWSTSPVQTSQNATGLAMGTYTCTVTDANGCTSMASTQITQPTQFNVAISSTTLAACANNPININANGSGGTGPYTYNWVAGPSTSAYSITETVAGNYNYIVNAVDAFNCPATANITLTYFAQPTVSATSATVCAGQGNAVLQASGATTYVWQPGNITGPTYPYSGSTSIAVTVVGTSNGCSNSANASVFVNPTPNANISVSNITGCVPSCLNFTATGSSSITSYGWMLNGVGITGAQNGAYCFDEAAQYTLGLTVMDAYGCTSNATPVIVNIHPQPVADFNHAPIKPIINQDPFVTFTDASWGANIVSWNWYFMSTAQYTSIEQNPQFMYTEPGTYPVALVVKSDHGCTDTIIRPLVVGEDFGIYVPNAFTPNGDGVNDIFQPKGFGVVEYELNIFDRWGEKVFSTKEFTEGWDGTFQGRKGSEIIKEDTYTWLINCTSVFGKSHELKGHVTLMK